MKKILLLTFALLALLSCKKGIDPFAGKECVTLDVSNVTQASATFNGYFLPQEREGLTECYCYFLCSTDKDHLTFEAFENGNINIHTIGPGSKEELIPDQNHQVHYKYTGGLTPGTTYYFRALIYAAIGAGEDARKEVILADNIKSFTTKAFDASKTQVTTKDVADAKPFKATLSATLASDAGEDVRRGGWFLYGAEGSTLEDLKAGGTEVKADFSEDGISFSASIANLKFGTTYSYVAYAFVADENALQYGEVKSFTTADFDLRVTTLEASAGPVKATLNASFSPDVDGLEVKGWFLVGPQGATLEALKADGIQVDALVQDQHLSAVTPLLSLNTPYCFVGAVLIAGKEAYGAIGNFSTTPRDVPEGAVEMGLSVLWGTRNVGADSPSDYGNFYAWGEVETKDEYNESNYKWSKGSRSGANGFTKYNSSETWGPVVDNKILLDPEDDAATFHWGTPWRMAKSAEWQELINNCDWEKTQQDGKDGYLVTSRITGNSIFLISVSYRTTTAYPIRTDQSFYNAKNRDNGFVCKCFQINKDGARSIENWWREYGTVIRPVRE